MLIYNILKHIVAVGNNKVIFSKMMQHQINDNKTLLYHHQLKPKRAKI